VTPGLVAALALVAVAAAYLVFKNANPDSAFAAAGADGSDSGGPSADAPGAPPPSGVAMQWNALIAQAAKAAGIDPVLLKAICAVETGFRPDSINPEQDFILDGVSYGQNDSNGRRLLVAWIKDGNDPASIGLNPSCGIAQVRVSNGKRFISGLDPWDLFDPATCLQAAAYLIQSDGTTLETADMYNVGHGLNWFRGVRNAAYQAKVADFYSRFAGDF
jgi:Transglycosylase SLT domain